MKDQRYCEHELERAKRLASFVQSEVLNMWVEARVHFAKDLFTYLKPEIEELIRRGEIK